MSLRLLWLKKKWKIQNTEKTSLNLAPQGTSLMRQLSHSSSSLPLSRGYLCNNNKAESSSSTILLLFNQSRFCSNPPTASSQRVSFSSSVSYRIKAKRLNKSAITCQDTVCCFMLNEILISRALVSSLLLWMWRLFLQRTQCSIPQRKGSLRAR